MELVNNINFIDLIPLINKKWLTRSLWKLKDRIDEGENVLKGFRDHITEYGFEPQIVFEIFSSKYDGKLLALCSENGEVVASFGLVKSLLDRFSESRPLDGRVALMCATLGGKVKEVGKGKFERGDYTDYFYLHGLAAALAEALTEYGHRKICDKLGLKYENSFRISPGYPVWPDLADQEVINQLLPLDRIGVSISETNQLIPEFSTTAMIFTLNA